MTQDLTRAEIEKLLHNMLGSPSLSINEGRSFNTITQLLRQLDAANGKVARLLKCAEHDQAKIDAEQQMALDANARADAAAGQMRERCEDAVSTIELGFHDGISGDYHPHKSIDLLQHAIGAIRVLPLHEEPAPEEPQLKRFYVTVTWEDWPEGGSYGTVVSALDHDAATSQCKREMADLRESDTDPEDENWHLVDCFDLDEFITNHMQP